MAVLERTAAALRVLAHPHRLKMVELLMEHDWTVGELAETLDIPPNACSQHLSLMRARGLLEAHRHGQAVHYRVCHPSAGNIIRCIRRHEMGNGEA